MAKIRSLSVMFLFAAAGSFGAPPSCNPNPLYPSILPTCQFDPGPIHVPDDTKGQEFDAAAAEARSRFRKVFPNGPNGPGFQDAQKALLRVLETKDRFYLMYALQHEVFGDSAKVMNALAMALDPLGLNPNTPRAVNEFPKWVDGGIRPFAFPLFMEWANAVRRAEGRDKAGQWAQPQILLEAIQDKSHWSMAYKDTRDWAEILSSGLDISKYVPPKVYMVNQMESDVASSLGLSKPADLDLPDDPKASSLALYDFFEKNFGKEEVFAAATAVLNTPKNSIGGLAKRAEVVIGGYLRPPSPNPYLLFLTNLTYSKRETNSSRRNYAIALCMMDQNGVLVTGRATEALNSKKEWAKALSVYGQLVAMFGEPAVVKAAGRLKDVPKDDRGGPQGDPDDKGAIFWFTALLKDPNTQLPDLSYFLASSYDPRWIGKVIDVRGTVARVELDTSGSPRYATIHFKESRNDRFTAFTPNSEILDAYGQNSSALVGKPIEIWGQVQDWNEGSGVRFLIPKQLKVLDAGALANFRESAPDWMKLPTPASNLVDSPKYLAWKKFPPGSKASYEYDSLHEYKPGTNQYTRTKISSSTLTLVSIDAERAIVKTESTISGKIAGRNGPDTTSSDQLIFKAKQAAPGAPVDDPSRIVTSGEETLTINGKKIATKWECVTRAGDPMTFTKTWTSDEVPGGLVRTQQQSHLQITGQTYRNISQTHYVPIDGVERQSGAASPAPSPAGNDAPAAANRGATPLRGRQDRSAMSTAGQPEFRTHYIAVMRRAAQARFALAQAQRKSSIAGVPLPDDIRTAQERLTSQQQAVNLAMRARDYTAGEQSLRALEDTLAVIEDFLANAGTPVIRGNPGRR
jgi:hypothetical protein